jgi:hypothetical protein
MMGRSFDDFKKNNDDDECVEASVQTAAAECLPDSAESSALIHPEQPIPDGSESDGQELTQTAHQQEFIPFNSVPTPKPLVDPLFKDCNRLSRFYIDHCMLLSALCPNLLV